MAQQSVKLRDALRIHFENLFKNGAKYRNRTVFVASRAFGP